MSNVNKGHKGSNVNKAKPEAKPEVATAVKPEVATAVKPEVAKQEKKVKTMAERLDEIKAKYPTQKITDGSLEFNEEKQKLSVEITCQHPGCKNKRRVFTSDLFQVRYCQQHVKEARKAAHKAKRAAAREALKAATPKA